MKLSFQHLDRSDNFSVRGVTFGRYRQ